MEFKQSGTDTETDTQIKGREQRAQKQTQEYMVNQPTAKDTRIYNVQKTVSLINNVGKTRELCAKE